MEKILTYKGAVMTWECDSNHHMNIMYYINKFEHASRHFVNELDILHKDSSVSLGMVVLEQNIKYHQEIFEDDLLYIESSLLAIGNKAFTMLHEMRETRTSELVSTMKVVSVLFDKVERKALPFPKEQKEILEQKNNLIE